MLSGQDDEILAKFEENLSQAALSSSTIVNYLTDLRAFRRWADGALAPGFSLAQTNPEHIRQYRDYLSKTLKRASSTINRHLMSLRKFFVFVTELGIVAINPTAGVALVQNNGRAESRPLSEEETEKLLKAARSGSRVGLARRDVAILQLLLRTGLRVGEIVDLQKDDLVFDNPGLHLKVCTGKGKIKTRKIPVPAGLCKILDSYLQVRPHSNTEHFFLSQEGRSISKRTVQRIISDCAKNAGVDGVSAQSMRRTFALQLFSKTQDLALVSKRLGHQNKSITERYLSIHQASQTEQHEK